jgi:hypothetical protein
VKLELVHRGSGLVRQLQTGLPNGIDGNAIQSCSLGSSTDYFVDCIGAHPGASVSIAE